MLYRAIAFVALCAPFLGGCATWPHSPMWPADDALDGSTEAAVVARYGQPRREHAGHYGLPPSDWTEQFKGDVKTSVFGLVDAELYVTFEKRDGQWVVIRHSNLPSGAEF